MLSGGQRQRVALARCLVTAPSLVLLDEPLANLDVHLRGSMEDEFAQFHKRTGTTMFYITHDQAEAMALADRIAVMDRGRLVQLATPKELYREPATAMVAEFVGRGIVVPAEIVADAVGSTCAARLFGVDVGVRCAQGQKATASGLVCLRPRDLRKTIAGEPGIPCRVTRATYQGGYFRVEAKPEAASGVPLVIHESDGIRLDRAIDLGRRDGGVGHSGATSRDRAARSESAAA